ncbi:uncharacterized protein LOC131250145 [Magnolia sinica]|uniref:uncharacterized protein LOC131250145 n=1 Tax=Magnolia sinica TaxID=86752 RepID=UPI00265A17FB|nr:uncharacterized protein LOC131250145 [Magnolia sinica]
MQNQTDLPLRKYSASMEEVSEDHREPHTSTAGWPAADPRMIHVNALDCLVNANSLFTIAVFLDLCLSKPGQQGLEDSGECVAGADVAEKLLVFEVVSFSFFLFSSLIAQGLKLAINLLNSKDVDEAFRAYMNPRVLTFGIIGSAVGTVIGCAFWMMTMVNVIQIKLGLLSCRSHATVRAVLILLTLVSSAVAVFIVTIISSVTRKT